MEPRSVAVVLLAAGKGERLGRSEPKAFVDLAGRSLLEHAIQNSLRVRNLRQLIITVPQQYLEQTLELERKLSKESVNIRVVVGGSTRQASVAEALAVIAGGIDVVLVHDSARALAPTELFDRVADAVFENQVGVIPALKVVDSIKRVREDAVLESVDRDTLVRAQTPQGFLTKVLVAAHLSANSDYTDDAALLQAYGATVMTVEGDEQAMKITTAADLEIAQSRLHSSTKVGVGVDSHRFDETGNRELWLGLTLWEGEAGLLGHSDGDVIAHAIVDALLGAAGLGDIGSNFGVDKPEFAGASGSVFLSQTLKLLEENGYTPLNVSVELVGDKPKLAPRRQELENVLSEAIGAPVSVSATTTDGLGFLSDERGIGAVATALIRKVGWGR